MSDFFLLFWALGGVGTFYGQVQYREAPIKEYRKWLLPLVFCLLVWPGIITYNIMDLMDMGES